MELLNVEVEIVYIPAFSQAWEIQYVVETQSKRS